MFIEIAEHARMSESGNSLLRLIQNNSFPVLDLLVREVVQNSLDAANQTASCVNMEFITNKFKPKSLNAHFDVIEEKLNARFPESDCDFLAIRDSNTWGLTGPLHFEDAQTGEFGNLLKLVYEISMPQQNEGAGGSWGLGKTVYFRVGIGLVIYYSRIKTNTGYESRMAATLVEDQTKDPMLPPAPGSQLRRGIAWWGAQTNKKNQTIPLVNNPEIKEILSVFGIQEYVGEETGTTVIIPYIDPTKLLPRPIEGHEQAWWENNVGDYLKVALQRWYAPRLMNSNYKYGKWLRAKINGAGIVRADFLPLFLVIQNLYNKVEDGVYFYQDVKVRNLLTDGGVAGYIGYTKLSKSQLDMLPPFNQPNPYSQARLHDIESESNAPILVYTRKPGMIVNYEISGKWVEGIPNTREDEFIIGVFVANSEQGLKEEYGGMSLEEYLRKSEKADHTSWADWVEQGFSQSQLVAKIQRGARKAIIEEFQEVAKEINTSRNIGLQRALAEMFLPPENFGKKSSLPTGGTGGGGLGGATGLNSRLNITAPLVFDSEGLSIEFQLAIGLRKKYAEVLLKVSTENGELTAEEWEEKIGKPFPASIIKAEIHRYKEEKHARMKTIHDLHVESGEPQEQNGITLQLTKTKKFGSWKGFIIETVDPSGYVCEGQVKVRLLDPQVECVITVQ